MLNTNAIVLIVELIFLLRLCYNNVSKHEGEIYDKKYSI